MNILNLKRIPRNFPTLAIAVVALASTPMAWANTWSGGGGANQNWSTTANWLENVAPEGTAILFFDPGAAGVAGTVNNIVSSSVAVSSLQYANTNGFHTTLIQPGQRLDISSGLIAGTEIDSGNAQVITATITGPGSTLNIGGGDLIVRQGSVTSGGTQRATLDMSGLDTFTATVGAVRVGRQNITRATGTLYLANTNAITASSEIDVAYNNSNPGGANYLYLGQTNSIFANNVYVGRRKTTGNLLFRTGLSAPTVLFRGSDGSSRINAWNIGDNSAETGTTGSGATGTVDLSGGTVDATVATMQVGRSKNGTATSGSAHGRGTLTYSAGVFDVDTLEIGYQGGANISSGIGTVNVNGTGLLLVNTSLRLGYTSGGGGAAGTSGTLNINGGMARVPAIETGAAGVNNTVTISGGTLVVTNTAGPGINTLAMTNGTLSLPVILNVPSAIVTNLVVGGTTNTLNLSSMPTISGYPAQFAVIQYSGSLSGEGFNFGLGTLPPASPAYAGYISNNVANNSIDFVLTGGPLPARSIHWTGATDGNWDTFTANWIFSGPTTYSQADFVVLDDSATGTTAVNLTTVLTPSSVTVNNTNKTYTLQGPGNLSGSTGITKEGPGTLVIKNDGINDFSGPIEVAEGTLRYSHAYDVTVSNSISGAGSLNQASSSVLTLAGNNSLEGPITVSQGTLRAGSSSALGMIDGGTTVASGATLDIGANNIDLGQEPITVSGDGVGGTGAIVNNSGNNNFVGPNLARVTLAGNTRIGGTGRWDLRTTAGTTADPALVSLSTGGNAYGLTKVGGNTVNIVAATIDPALGDIAVNEGILSFEGNITSAGDPARNLTVAPGATLRFWAVTNRFDKNIILQEGGLVANGSGANTVIGPMTLNGAGTTFTIAGTSLTLSNTITGPGLLTKNGSAPLILAGTANHTGGTLISAGNLQLDGIHASALTNIGATTITGQGTNNGYLEIGGDLQPGAIDGAGTFTVNGDARLMGSGSAGLTFDLGPVNTIGNGVNDLLQINGNLTAEYIGVVIRPLTGTLQAGSYRLVNYTGTKVGELSYPVIFGGGQTRYNFALDTTVAHQIDLVVSGTQANLKWNSSSSGVWDVLGSQNWLNLASSVADIFYDGDTVLFDDTPGVRTAITLDVPAAPSILTNNSSVNNFTFSGAGAISGFASLVKLGSSTLTISNANTFSGPVTIAGGTLKVGNATALGTTAGNTVITNGGTLDVNGVDIGGEPLLVSGKGANDAGALVNKGPDQTGALQLVTLAGDTTVGGTGRFDIRGGGAFLSTSNSNYGLTKVGTNQFSIVNTTVDPEFGDVDVQEGVFAIQTQTAQLGMAAYGRAFGNPTNTITVRTNATLNIWDLGVAYPMDKVIALQAGATLWNDSGNSVLSGPITLDGQTTVSTDGGSTLSISNIIAGSGGLTKTGSGTLILGNANTYGGSTAINGGTVRLGAQGAIGGTAAITIASGATLAVGDRTDGILTLGGSQILAGNGTVAGAVTASSGTTVAPGVDGIGALTLSTAVVLGGTTTMELGVGTNDLIQGATSINYGGTLNLVFEPGTLAGGNSFKLFSANTYSGSFTVTPATPGTGLAWDTSTLTTDGTLRVIQSVNTTPTDIKVAVVDGNLELSWPADHTGWRLQAQTNAVNVGLSNNWVDVPSSTGTNRVVVTPNPADGSVFYRMVYP